MVLTQRRVLLPLLVLGVVLLRGGAASPVASTALNIPSALAGYRTWRAISRPTIVPRRVWGLCAERLPNSDAIVRGTDGPHAKRYIRVYANDLAVSAFATGARPFPAGAMIAKEKFLGPGAPEPSGVGFMVKKDDKELPDSSGWVFSYYPSQTADTDLTQRSCVPCHRAAAKADYVLGAYPQP